MSEKPDMAKGSKPTNPKPDRPAKGDLMPPNWAAIETHFRAGILSVRTIASQYGVSHTLVNRRAKEDGWIRNSKPDVLARANELVSTQGVSKSVSTATPEQLAETVENSAQALAIVLMGQRASITRGKRIVDKLMAELEELMDHPELAHMVYDALSAPEDKATPVALQDLARLITGLPERARVVKTLTEALGAVVGLERESYGLKASTEEGGGLPTAIIRDYTGKDDPDSPGVDTERED